MILQASAVPFRIVNGQVEFCLITSAGNKRWIFPKGIIDPGETYVETALKESFEEAGIEGEVVGEPLGSYEFQKWGTTLHVKVVLMRVTHCADSWLEAAVRTRQWMTLDDARNAITRTELQQMLELAWGRLETDGALRDEAV